jgi:predicted O-methyltransferase YrrM
MTGMHLIIAFRFGLRDKKWWKEIKRGGPLFLFPGITFQYFFAFGLSLSILFANRISNPLFYLLAMYSHFQLAKKYLHYYLTASNGKGHGIHSPFVFEFIVNVLNDHRHFYTYETVEFVRRQLLKDKNVLTIEDFGAGSAIHSSKQRSIASIARHAVKNKKLSQLLFRIVHHYQPQTILELGTSLGISTAYMALANPQAHIITIEGSPSVAKVAKQNHQFLHLHNIDVITGKFDDILPGSLQQLKTIDVGFVDGNHSFEPTRRYFEQMLTKATSQSIFIFDDIHWSKEMEEAWHVIKQHDAVTASIDLFFFGIVLFRSEFRSKREFTIRF